MISEYVLVKIAHGVEVTPDEVDPKFGVRRLNDEWQIARVTQQEADRLVAQGVAVIQADLRIGPLGGRAPGESCLESDDPVIELEDRQARALVAKFWAESDEGGEVTNAE